VAAGSAEQTSGLTQPIRLAHQEDRGVGDLDTSWSRDHRDANGISPFSKVDHGRWSKLQPAAPNLPLPGSIVAGSVLIVIPRSSATKNLAGCVLPAGACGTHRDSVLLPHLVGQIENVLFTIVCHRNVLALSFY